MKLNTNNIFNSSLKTTPKIKNKKPIKPKLSSPFVNMNLNSKNKTNANSKVKDKLFKTSNKKNNPFIQTLDEDHKLKFIKPLKKSTKKVITIQPNKEEKENLFEDSYINNIMLTSGSDTLENNRKDKENELNQKELSYEQLCNLYKQSNLKSTIIIDDNGNNNLDAEQINLINNYFNKKNNINKKFRNNCIYKNIKIIPTQINKDSNTLVNRINHLKSSTIDTNDKTNNINTKINNIIKKNKIVNSKKDKNIYIKIKEDFDENKNKTAKNHSNLKPTKMKTCLLVNKFLINDDNLVIEKKNKKGKQETEKNSIFEASSDQSFNSSFLGSSFDEHFYQNLNQN